MRQQGRFSERIGAGIDLTPQPLVAATIAAAAAFAHGVSISRGTLQVENGVTRLEVRMALPELDHLPQAQRNLVRHFSVNDEAAVSANCRGEDREMVCRGTFLTDAPRTVECRLGQVVSPDHVHTLQFGARTTVFTATAARQSLETRPQFLALAAGGTFILLIAFMLVRLWQRTKSPMPEQTA